MTIAKVSPEAVAKATERVARRRRRTAWSRRQPFVPWTEEEIAAEPDRDRRRKMRQANNDRRRKLHHGAPYDVKGWYARRARRARERKRKAAAAEAYREREFQLHDALGIGRAHFRGKSNAARMRYDRPGWQVMVDRMEPGAWYALPDIRALMHESPSGSMAMWLKLAMRHGRVVRALNPDLRPALGRTVRGPRWLYSRVGG